MFNLINLCFALNIGLIAYPNIELMGQGTKYNRSDYKNFQKNRKPIPDSIQKSKTYTILNTLLTEGYLESYIDSLQVDSSKSVFKKGEPYYWEDFTFNDSTLYNYKPLQKIKLKRANPILLERILEQVIKNKTSKGYPFYTIDLTPTVKSNHRITIDVHSSNHELETKIDTIVFLPSLKIKHGFILNYLGINNGDLYNLHLIGTIKENLNRLPFLDLRTPTTSRFSTQGAIIEIPVIAKPTGTFGGMVGFSSDEITGKIKITGDINLKLSNALKNGETINLFWKKTATQSQTLLANLELPYIFNSQFGFYSDIDLQKKDSTELRVKTKFTGIYHLIGLNQFRAGINNISQRFLNNKDTSKFDTKTLLYQIDLIINTLDNITYPTKGLNIHSTVEAGNRQTLDSTQHKSTIYKFEKSLSFYQKVSNKSSFHISYKIGLIESKTKLFMGELLQIGGLNSLRGFDENSIQANKYYFAMFEYRYQLERTSIVFAFAQGGQYWVESTSQNRNSVVGSGGIGTSLDSGKGIFSIIYALGYDSNIKFKLQNSKIHFGYIVKF